MYLRRSKNKYRNNPIIIDGIRFDSTKEGHGVKTQEYKLKKKMMLYIYGIEIHEV